MITTEKQKPDPLRGINRDGEHYRGKSDREVWSIILQAFARRRILPDPTQDEEKGKFEAGMTPSEAWVAICDERLDPKAKKMRVIARDNGTRFHVAGPGVFSCFWSSERANAQRCANILNDGGFLSLPDGEEKTTLLLRAKQLASTTAPEA